MMVHQADHDQERNEESCIGPPADGLGSGHTTILKVQGGHWGLIPVHKRSCLSSVPVANILIKSTYEK